MMCHSIGFSTDFDQGLGLVSVSSESRVPSPPANITAFIPRSHAPVNPLIPAYLISASRAYRSSNEPLRQSAKARELRENSKK